jgi:hypothetical protein
MAAPRARVSNMSSPNVSTGMASGDAGVDAGPGVSAVAAGEPAALSALRIPLCRRSLRARPAAARHQ